MVILSFSKFLKFSDVQLNFTSCELNLTWFKLSFASRVETILKKFGQNPVLNQHINDFYYESINITICILQHT